MMLMSVPAVSRTTSETVVYLGRATELSGNFRVAVVAEVPVAMISDLLAAGTDLRGLSITLQRDDGQVGHGQARVAERGRVDRRDLSQRCADRLGREQRRVLRARACEGRSVRAGSPEKRRTQLAVPLDPATASRSTLST